MNTLAMIFTLICGGLVDGTINSDGKYEELCPDGYVFVNLGEQMKYCYVIDKAVKYGIHNYNVYEFESKRIVEKRLTLYAYHVKVKNKKTGNEEPKWFYFSLTDEDEVRAYNLKHRVNW